MALEKRNDSNKKVRVLGIVGCTLEPFHLTCLFLFKVCWSSRNRKLWYIEEGMRQVEALKKGVLSCLFGKIQYATKV